MVAVRQPVHEKLTLLWHNHFATSAQKVRVAAYMAAQNHKLRTLSLGDFRTLAYTMLTDAAMLRWLDGQTNTARAPNENLAREFMELFALGHGNGYTSPYHPTFDINAIPPSVDGLPPLVEALEPHHPDGQKRAGNGRVQPGRRDEHVVEQQEEDQAGGGDE